MASPNRDAEAETLDEEIVALKARGTSHDALRAFLRPS